MQLPLAEDPILDVLPHAYSILGLHITNQMIMALVSGVLMLLIFPRLFAKADSGPPTGAKNFFEAILEFLRIEVFRPALKEHTDKFVPFLWTMFFFILFCNVLGCIPFPAFFYLISGGHVVHLGGAATAGISTTAALALCAFFFIHAHGIDTVAHALMDGTYGQHAHHDDHGGDEAYDLEHMRGEALAANIPNDFKAVGDPTGHYADGGPDHHCSPTPAHKVMSPVIAILTAIPLYLWNFAPHPFRPGPGESNIKWLADIPMFAFLLVLELFGALIKPFALCMRLFANMVAGHVLLAVLVSLIVAVPLGLMHFVIGIPIGLLDLGIQVLEIFVAFLQAYIFTFLTTLFLASAVAPEH